MTTKPSGGEPLFEELEEKARVAITRITEAVVDADDPLPILRAFAREIQQPGIDRVAELAAFIAGLDVRLLASQESAKALAEALEKIGCSCYDSAQHALGIPHCYQNIAEAALSTYRKSV